MKKIFISILVLLLSACFSGDDVSVENSSKTYENTYFKISYPENWEKIKDLTSAPKGVIAVFRSTESQDGVFSNLSIVEDDLAGSLSSSDFAKINIESLPMILQNFQSVEKKDVEIAGHKTIIFTFIGRENIESLDMEYSQVYFVKNKKGIVLTLIYPISLSQSEKEELRLIFNTFYFK